MNISHWRKYATVLLQPAYLGAVRQRVMPGIEHSDAIRYVKPGTLLDVGANKGQFSAVVRHLFPKAAIFAFEPLPAERARLEASVPGTKTVFPFAVGETKGPATFYETDRPDSSSLLEPGKGDDNVFGIAVRRSISIEVAHIQDHVDLAGLTGPVMMKIDVQGAEMSVLRSLGESIRHIDAIYCEVSFVPLYEGQPLATEVCAYLFAHGFTLRGTFNPSFVPASGPVQADFLFERVALQA